MSPWDRIASPRAATVVSAAAGLVLGLASAGAAAVPEKPAATAALWSGQTWGIVQVVPRVARHGDQIHMHGMVVGGPAAEPWWSCSQYSGWLPNGTSRIALVVSGDWEMPYTGFDIFDQKVNVMDKDGGPKPPYGWENRISDTCYCEVTTFGATGGCQTREVKPELFLRMDQFNPRQGNIQFATVTSRNGWYPIQARFSGYAGVGWSDDARDYVYVVGAAELADDADGDGLADAWEYAHSENHDLGDFGGGAVDADARAAAAEARAARTWVSPYAPREPGWISAGPNDWDGDGISNRDEFLGWRDRKRDGAGFPFDPTFINEPPLDPFLCYAAKTSKGTPKLVPVPGLALADDFESGAADVKKLRRLCAPADLDGTPAHTPAIHLVSYLTKPAKGAPKHQKRTGIAATTALGTLTFDTKKAELLLVPAAKDLTTPPAPPAAGTADAYKCYAVKITKGTPKLPKGLQVTLADQFTGAPKIYDVRKALHLCNPVGVDGATTIRPTSGALCYQVKLAKQAPKQPKHVKRVGVHVADALGALTVDVVKDEVLCLSADVARDQ